MARQIGKEALPSMMKYAFNDGKIPEKEKQYIKMILTGGSSSGVYKEELVLHKLGYELDENTRDYDGYVDGRPVEVKSESYVPLSETSKTKKACNGAFAFGAPANPKQKANQNIDSNIHKRPNQRIIVNAISIDSGMEHTTTRAERTFQRNKNSTITIKIAASASAVLTVVTALSTRSA